MSRGSSRWLTAAVAVAGLIALICVAPAAGHRPRAHAADAQQCADPHSDLTKLRQEGRNLYDLLVAPFEAHLEPNRFLIVEPDSI